MGFYPSSKNNNKEAVRYRQMVSKKNAEAVEYENINTWSNPIEP